MKGRHPSTHKKVVVVTFEGTELRGYVNPQRFSREAGFELLDAAGEYQQLPWNLVKIAWFVRDWDDRGPGPAPNAFPRRPRQEGLWVRLSFRDGETLEGLLVNDLLRFDPYGYLLTPPDANGNHQKAFVPRSALTALDVLAAIPSRGQPQRRRRRGGIDADSQPDLFPR